MSHLTEFISCQCDHGVMLLEPFDLPVTANIFSCTFVSDWVSHSFVIAFDTMVRKRRSSEFDTLSKSLMLYNFLQPFVVFIFGWKSHFHFLSQVTMDF